MAGDAWPLASRTPVAWATAAAAHRDELLLEQAHLEKKAGAAAATFLFRLPPDPVVQRELSTLAREEFVHFERTLRLLQRRGLPLREQRPGPYAQKLKAAVAQHMPDRLLDELLVSALIEARSCERMGLLAAAVAGGDPELAAFWRDLAEAEARHGPTYVEAALGSFPAERVRQRWAMLAAHEAQVLAALPFTPRLHGGVADLAEARP